MTATEPKDGAGPNEAPRRPVSLAACGSLLALAACNTEVQGPSSTAQAGRAAYEQTASYGDALRFSYVPSVGVPIVASLIDGSPGATIATADKITFTFDSSCGSDGLVRESCRFSTGGVTVSCDSSLGPFEQCNFKSSDGTDFRITYTWDGRFVLASDDTFQSGVWYQAALGSNQESWRDARSPLFERMSAIYRQSFEASVARNARAASERRRRNERAFEDFSAILRGVAAGLSDGSSGSGAASGVGRGCDGSPCGGQSCAIE